MGIFVIGDLHLSLDEKVNKSMDIFGGIWEKHWQTLERNWRKNISSEDTVIIAGDISWGLKLPEAMTDLMWIHNLPGKKILFKGNHDLWWSGVGKLNKLFDDMIFVQNRCCFADNVFICGSRGWNCPGSEGFTSSDDKIYKRELLRLENSLREAYEMKNMSVDCRDEKSEIIGILHYPPTNDKKQSSGFTELFEKYGVKRVFYGHLHNEDAKKNRESISFNGVSYKLISFDAIDGNPYKIQ